MTVLYEKLHGSNGALESLSQLDTDITKALKTYGPPPDRSLPATFQTLARSIVGQQISGAAASSVWNRMKEAKLATEDVISNLEPDDMMPLGLSRRKAEYIIGIAKEITSGDLVLESLPEMSGDEVQKRLVQIRGIGAWTADNYRLFALADLDAWPVADIALQEGMKILKSLDTRPDVKIMESMGEPWKPFRGVGALILWHIYGSHKRKATIADI
jgi:DNA-3-methyladenine glycosylase II|tara:strand:- start:1254 stop:1898 length:645 start_codon:yes stop_codon:yes gene_type:complete